MQGGCLSKGRNVLYSGVATDHPSRDILSKLRFRLGNYGFLSDTGHQQGSGNHPSNGPSALTNFFLFCRNSNSGLVRKIPNLNRCT